LTQALGSNKVKIARGLQVATVLLVAGVILYWLVRVEGVGRDTVPPAQRMAQAREALRAEALPRIPPPPEAREVPILPGRMAAGGGVYESAAALDDVEGFYRRHFCASGWEERPERAARLQEAAGGEALAFARDEVVCIVWLSPLEQGREGTAVVVRFERAKPAQGGEE